MERDMNPVSGLDDRAHTHLELAFDAEKTNIDTPASNPPSEEYPMFKLVFRAFYFSFPPQEQCARGTKPSVLSALGFRRWR